MQDQLNGEEAQERDSQKGRLLDPAAEHYVERDGCNGQQCQCNERVGRVHADDLCRVPYEQFSRVVCKHGRDQQVDHNEDGALIKHAGEDVPARGLVEDEVDRKEGDQQGGCFPVQYGDGEDDVIESESAACQKSQQEGKEHSGREIIDLPIQLTEYHGDGNTQDGGNACARIILVEGHCQIAHGVEQSDP